jgi:hypothetical protein
MATKNGNIIGIEIANKTPIMTTLENTLESLPTALRSPLIAEFEAALSEYRAADWEKVGLKAGKFCEIAYCICLGHAEGKFPEKLRKPDNFPKACERLQDHNVVKGRSLCIQVPRVLVALYELRNNRAIGHVSSEISPNHMDAELYIRIMKWVLAEFIRNFSKMQLDESHAVVEAITARTYHIVWTSGDIRRILDPAKTAIEKVLILLYGSDNAISIKQLSTWIEYQNMSRFKKNVIEQLHKQALIHFDRNSENVRILPPGQLFVEQNNLLIMSMSR